MERIVSFVAIYVHIMAETQNPSRPLDDNAKKIMIDFYKEALSAFLGFSGPDFLVPYVRYTPIYTRYTPITSNTASPSPAAEEGASVGSRLAGQSPQ